MHSARHVALTWNQALTKIPAESASAPSARADIRADARSAPRELSEGIGVMHCRDSRLSSKLAWKRVGTPLGTHRRRGCADSAASLFDWKIASAAIGSRRSKHGGPAARGRLMHGGDGHHCPSAPVTSDLPARQSRSCNTPRMWFMACSWRGLHRSALRTGFSAVDGVYLGQLGASVPSVPNGLRARSGSIVRRNSRRERLSEAPDVPTMLVRRGLLFLD